MPKLTEDELEKERKQQVLDRVNRSKWFLDRKKMNLIKRDGAQVPVLVGLPLIIFLSFLTWERNHEWSDEYLLFVTEYERGYRDDGPDDMT